MKIILALLSTLTTVYSIQKSTCHACFDGVCYSRARVNNTHNISGQLAVDRAANIVHFHYEDKFTDHTAAYDLRDIKWLEIPGIDFSFARTVDQSKRNIYIGGAKGILKYNPVTNTTTKVGLFDRTIWQMQFKDKIFFTVFKKKGLFTFENKKTKSVAPLSSFSIDDFVVDKRDDIYFTSNLTTYRLKKGDSKPKIFANLTYNLVTDTFDNAFFIQTSNRGLYRMNYEDGRLSMVGAFASGTPFKSVFDKLNNIIYYDPSEETLFYLTPNYGRCRVTFDLTKVKKKNNRKYNFAKNFPPKVFGTMKNLKKKTTQEIRDRGGALGNLHQLIVVPTSNKVKEI